MVSIDITIPQTMKAVVIEEDRRASIKDLPVPSVGDHDVLIKTVSIAQNPTDWKRFVHGSAFSDEGAFAEFVKTPADLVWVVPDNTFSHDEAATLGCAFWTAVQALCHPTRLGLVEPPAKASGDEWIFVYGGSSAVGQFAVRLAALSGYRVVSTASPRNFDLVKSLGASEVFDYKDPKVVSKIKAATGDSIKKAVDTISEKVTQRITAETIAPSGGEIILVLGPEDATLIYTALGRAFDFLGGSHYPVSEEDRTHMAQFLLKVPKLVRDGAVKPLPIKFWEGGLTAVPDGMQYMREGKVSAEEIVHRV
ncbi:GroES-like protein [Fomes fomentarius]|nr:GroES-like protein [Fomes fomentarius]